MESPEAQSADLKHGHQHRGSERNVRSLNDDGESTLRNSFHSEASLNLPSTTHRLYSGDRLHPQKEAKGHLSAPGPVVLIQVYLKSRRGGWGRRHSRLIQWFVLFDVVHPGQHCPPQTFLLWSHQSKVNTRRLGGRTIHMAHLGQD